MTMEPDRKTPPDDVNIIVWLEEQAQDGDYLLAHALDGVIWGKREGDKFIISHDIDAEISPSLTANTLQQARIFNKDRELFIWRDHDRWLAREIADGDKDDYFDETHILWGTQGTAQASDFTLLEDGSQGLRHIVPIDASRISEKNIRPILTIRHYCAEDDLGVNFIAFSRLVDIEVNTYE